MIQRHTLGLFDTMARISSSLSLHKSMTSLEGVAFRFPSAREEEDATGWFGRLVLLGSPGLELPAWAFGVLALLEDDVAW